MDSQEIVRSYYAAFNRQDWEGMLSLLDENIVHDANEGGSESGKNAFRAFLARMNDHYAEQVEDLAIMTAPEASRAAAEFFIRGKYLKTDPGLPEANGQAYHLRVGAFFEIQNAKITRVTNYYNLRQWIGMVACK